MLAFVAAVLIRTAEMTFPLLPLDLWKVVCRDMALGEKFRLELVCTSFHQQLWPSLVVDTFPNDNHKQVFFLELFVSRPVLCEQARKLTLRSDEFYSGSIMVKFVTQARHLTHLNIDEPFIRTGSILNVAAASRCPLKNVCIVSEFPNFYRKIDGKSLGALRPTLRRLTLLALGPKALAAPSKLIKSIALTFQDTLVTLGLTAEEWSSLQSMTALQELYIANQKPYNFQEGKKLLETILDRTPKSVGVNFWNKYCADPTRPFTSLLSAAYTQNDLGFVKELVTVHGANPTFSLWSNDPAARDSPIQTFSKRKIECVKALVRAGAETTHLPFLGIGHASLFHSYLLQTGKDDEDVLKWLFDEPWAAASKNATVAELLGFPPEQTSFRLLNAVSHKSIFTWVYSRPDIFGNRSGADRDSEGKSLIHHCHGHTQLTTALHFKADWRVRDKFGENGIEHIAHYDNSGLVSFLLGSNSCSDEEFDKLATPSVWGAVTDLETYNRMLRVVPQERWLLLLIALVQIHIRRENYDTVGFLLETTRQDIKELVRKAIFAPQEEVMTSDWFRSYHLREHKPLAYYLAKIPTLTAARSRRYTIMMMSTESNAFPSAQARTEWFGEYSSSPDPKPTHGVVQPKRLLGKK